MQETRETQVRFLGQEDPLEKEMATHSSILAWNPSPNAPGRAPNHIHTTLRWGRAPGKPSLCKSTGVGCHFLFQGIFLTQGLNLCFLQWQEDSLVLSHQESSMYE